MSKTQAETHNGHQEFLGIDIRCKNHWQLQLQGIFGQGY
jgi:hypothetical protein